MEHEYTLVPLDKMKEEWWSEGLKDDVRIQWKVDQDRKEVAAVRMIYNDQKLDAVLCISLDYHKIFSRRKMVELLQTKTVQFFITKLV